MQAQHAPTIGAKPREVALLLFVPLWELELAAVKLMPTGAPPTAGNKVMACDAVGSSSHAGIKAVGIIQRCLEYEPFSSCMPAVLILIS